MSTQKIQLDVIDAINQRCSVRAYRQKPVEREIIMKLLAAAVRAPTAMHQEPWGFVVIEDRLLLKQISDRAKPLFVAEMHHAHFDSDSINFFEQPDFNIFYNAGLLILICGKASNPMTNADCWLAAENLMLASCAFGLGSCVIGSATEALNQAEIKAELGIPEYFDVIAPIIIGEPAAKTEVSKRKDPVIINWK